MQNVITFLYSILLSSKDIKRKKINSFLNSSSHHLATLIACVDMLCDTPAQSCPDNAKSLNPTRRDSPPLCSVPRLAFVCPRRNSPGL